MTTTQSTPQTRTDAEQAALAAYTALRANVPTRELAVASRDAIRELASVTGIDEDTAHDVVARMYRKVNG